jgi:protein-L-isoaspartate O-methyltransferase
MDGTGRRREAFDEVADLYDRARPGYPPALVADLAQLAALGPDSRVLEIGCGTGQLTAALAALGSTLVAVELGPRLAEVARLNLAGFPAVEVVTADFESWPLPDVPFDLVVSATAFHWIDPAVRVPKAVAALRPGGSLAVIETHHVAGGTPSFFDRSQACYLRFEPGTRTGFRLPVAGELTTRRPELDDSPLLGAVALRSYLRDLEHTAGSYTDVLATYSNVRGLSPENRDGLLSCLATLIDSEFGGRVTTSVLNELRVAATV